MRATLEGLVFQGKVEGSLAEQAERILYWGLGQIPAPSRLLRLWESAESFMTSPVKIATDLHKPVGSLYHDSSSFLILVHAPDALEIINVIREEYERRFAHARQHLPLHLSATVFRRKAPLYLALEAARRFRSISTIKADAEKWTLVRKKITQQGALLTWQPPAGAATEWAYPEIDIFRDWFIAAVDKRPTPIDALKEGAQYLIQPSTFDYEVLDASIRRYDIVYDSQDGRRGHYMSRNARPRPYYLENLKDWQRYKSIFAAGPEGKTQRRTAIEMLGRLHMEWRNNPNSKDQIFKSMAADILVNTLEIDKFDAATKENLLAAACDGSFFDLCEWYDFIGK